MKRIRNISKVLVIFVSLALTGMVAAGVDEVTAPAGQEEPAECMIPEGCDPVPQPPDDVGICVIGVPSPCNAPAYWGWWNEHVLSKIPSQYRALLPGGGVETPVVTDEQQEPETQPEETDTQLPAETEEPKMEDSGAEGEPASSEPDSQIGDQVQEQESGSAGTEDSVSEDEVAEGEPASSEQDSQIGDQVQEQESGSVENEQTSDVSGEPAAGTA